MQWTPDSNDRAGEIARDFLRGENDLLELASARTGAVLALSRFLENSAEYPLSVERAESGDLLVRAKVVGEALLVTGKTARVLARYIDSSPVLMQDRLDMTARRSVVAFRA